MPFFAEMYIGLAREENNQEVIDRLKKIVSVRNELYFGIFISSVTAMRISLEEDGMFNKNIYKALHVIGDVVTALALKKLYDLA